jgi:hypothetical protein
VRIALKGFTKEWEVLMKCVVGWEHLPFWSIMRDDFTQEEIREGYQSSGHKGDGSDEENVVLVTKRKIKKHEISGEDLRKVICFF